MANFVSPVKSGGSFGRPGLAAVATAGLASASAYAADGAIGAGSPQHAVTAARPHQRSTSGVRGGALFGGTTNLVSEQHRLGRKLAIVRVYYHFGEHFPVPEHRQLMARHQTLLVSLDARRGGPGSAAVTAGREGWLIRPFLKAMNHDAVRYHLGVIYFCYQHEPDITVHNGGLGIPAQYREAWDHVRELARRMYLTRLRWVFILTHRDYLPPGHRPRWMHGLASAAALWPGKQAVDIVAADGYDSPGCKPGTSPRNYHATPASVFGPVLRFARAHGHRAVFASEWGASARFPAQQVRFIREMAPFVAAHRVIGGVLYWDNVGPTCSYSVNHRPRALAALRAMGHDRDLQGYVSRP